MAELKKSVREVTVQGSIEAIRALLDVLQTLLNEPGADAAAIRAACVRYVMELVEEIREVTG